jgi:hypothetical protein
MRQKRKIAAKLQMGPSQTLNYILCFAIAIFIAKTMFPALGNTVFLQQIFLVCAGGFGIVYSIVTHATKAFCKHISSRHWQKATEPADKREGYNSIFKVSIARFLHEMCNVQTFV